MSAYDRKEFVRDMFEKAAAIQFGVSMGVINSYRSKSGGYDDPSPEIPLSDSFVFYMLGRLDAQFEQMEGYK